MSEIINISDIKEKIKNLREQADSLQAALEVLLGKYDTILSYSPPVASTSTQTFKEIVNALIVKQNKPLKGREIYNLFQQETGRKMEYSTFSAQLSTMLKGGFIKKDLSRSGASSIPKFYYGLPNWFEDNNLKDDYLKKIKPE